jgi:hypothetical protein
MGMAVEHLSWVSSQQHVEDRCSFVCRRHKEMQQILDLGES